MNVFWIVLSPAKGIYCSTSEFIDKTEIGVCYRYMILRIDLVFTMQTQYIEVWFHNILMTKWSNTPDTLT